jgi:hypothetical protein
LLINSILDSPTEPPEPPRFPALAPDFWTSFYSDGSYSSSTWKQIGESKKLPWEPKTLTHTEPTIVSWEWDTPADIADRIGLLLVIDSPEDAIPEGNKIFSNNIERLVRTEKHIGIRLVTVR